ncbi:tachykinin-like peptides receptor 86C, partial [Dinothrombium tinctorium]
YVIVANPLKPRSSKKVTTTLVLLIWFSASLLAMPALIFSATLSFEFMNGGTRTVCALLWPDGYATKSKMDYIYNIVLFVVTYAIPMISMGITYSLMARILWGSKQIGEMTVTQRISIRAKQKVIPMLIVVTVVFGICWLPYHLYFIYVYHNLHVTANEYIQHLYLGFYWLAMANSAFNPFIYGLLNK